MVVIKILQIVIAILLTITILLQNRESGLSGAFGGGNSSNVYMTKRGADKFLFTATIVLAIVFFGLSIVSLFI